MSVLFLIVVISRPIVGVYTILRDNRFKQTRVQWDRKTLRREASGDTTDFGREKKGNAKGGHWRVGGEQRGHHKGWTTMKDKEEC